MIPDQWLIITFSIVEFILGMLSRVLNYFTLVGLVADVINILKFFYLLFLIIG